MARAKVMDDEVRKFIDKNHQALIISIGCGLDTRFERVDNGKITWYNFDFPEVIKIREKFFEKNERVFNISKSALDSSWPDEISFKNKKILIISEGVLQYFSEEEVKKFLYILTDKFEEFEAHFDLSHKLLVNHEKNMML